MKKALLPILALFCATLLTAPLLAQGTLEEVRVMGASLQGNLEGDDPERTVFVYLPPGYADNPAKRYPVVYFLHGYGVGAPVYVNGVLQLPDSVDAAMAAGARDTIIVVPDALTIYGGSMYSNSPTIGDWERFVAQDLVAYIDANYRTLATRESRGLSGHSMGGYGTLRIGMKHPEVFSAIYAMSSCCLLNQAPGLDAVNAQVARMAEGPVANAGGFNNAMQAQAAAWAPNPANAPYYFDWPFKDGQAQPVVQGRWTANSPVVFVGQYVPALKSFTAIQLDIGDKDGLITANNQLVEELTRFGIEHGYEVYDGDHGNRVGQRFIDEVLPFFEQHLQP